MIGVSTFRVHLSIAEIPREAWDALVPPEGWPLLSWTLLHALEESGCVSWNKGWAPAHLAIWRGRELRAASPAYVKSHNLGEFYYEDFRWPMFAAQMGVAYYPRLVLCVPFNPVAGPRALVAPGEDRAQAIAALAEGARAAARHQGWCSVHVLFPLEDELRHWREAGFLISAGMQYHWQNRGYRTFEDWLADLASKKRTQIRRERAQAARDGVVIRTVAGAALDEDLLRFAFRAYAANVDKHAMWSHIHLNEAYFLALGRRMPERVEVVVCEERGRPIGAAFNLRGDRRLLGRHWGALEERRFLHFHACLYHPVERCIALGLEAFEPGAGGEHKWARGYSPVEVGGAHWFQDGRLQQVMARYLPRQVLAMRAAIEDARRRSPCRDQRSKSSTPDTNRSA